MIESNWTAAGVGAGIIFAGLVTTCAARANAPIPRAEWTDEAKLYLAHAVQIEGGSEADAVAIAHVLAYRWRVNRQGWTLAEQIRRYVRPLWLGPQTPRQERILYGQKTWADVPKRIRNLLERWAAGEEPSPCPRAVHWAGRQQPTPLRPARCRERVYNRFYRAPTS